MEYHIVLVLSATVLVLVIEKGQSGQSTSSTTIGLTSIAYRSNTSPLHLLLRGRWRDFKRDEHFVVICYEYFDADDDNCEDHSTIGPDYFVYDSPSFEAWLCRYLLEYEIVFAYHDRTQMLSGFHFLRAYWYFTHRRVCRLPEIRQLAFLETLPY